MKVLLHVLRLGPFLLVCALWGCAPLTISKEAAIDFERYPSVLVAVTSTHGTADTAYLVQQMAETSGFRVVTVVDTPESTTALLEVEVVVTESVEVDSAGNTDTDYEGQGHYSLVDRATGGIVDSGHIEESSSYLYEASEDVLDRLALHYFRPFRL